MRKVLSGLAVLVGLLLVPGLHAATTLNYAYDANGSMVSGDGKYFEYNDANQLVRVRHGNAGGPVIAEYVYDYNGQRIKKIENGVVTYYVGKHFEQEVAGETKTSESYYFANGERVARKDSGGAVSYYHSDHLGGTNVVSNSAGSLVERISYYPFGEPRAFENEQYSYTGKEKDLTTDLYYFEARYYSENIKHFTQSDTIIPNYYVPQDLNKYAYTRNNPLRYIDPSGHKHQDAKNSYDDIDDIIVRRNEKTDKWSIGIAGTEWKFSKKNTAYNWLQSAKGKENSYTKYILAKIESKNIPEGSIIEDISGHSLGGMEAQIVAKALSSKYKIEKISTYGSPVVTDEVEGIKYDRLAAPGDVVPFLSVRFKDNVEQVVNTEYKFSLITTAKNILSPGMMLLNNHSVGSSYSRYSDE